MQLSFQTKLSPQPQRTWSHLHKYLCYARASFWLVLGWFFSIIVTITGFKRSPSYRNALTVATVKAEFVINRHRNGYGNADDEFLYRLLIPRFRLWLHMMISWLRRLIGVDSTCVLLGRMMIRNQFVLKALDEGVEQLIVFAGGYDILSFQLLDNFEKVHILELDVKDLQRKKIEKISSGLPSNLQSKYFESPRLKFQEITLGFGNLADAMATGGICKGKKTAVIMEGLVMYLTRLEMDSILTVLRTAIGNEADILVYFDGVDKAIHEHVEKPFLHRCSDVVFPMQENFLAIIVASLAEARGSPLRFGLSFKDIGSLNDDLSLLGLHLRRFLTTEEMIRTTDTQDADELVAMMKWFGLSKTYAIVEADVTEKRSQ